LYIAIFTNIQHLFKGEYDCLELLRKRWTIWQTEFQTIKTAK